jgi:ABC-type multidrug transport system permease subunit
MTQEDMPPSTKKYWPLAQLTLARLREFYREPEAVFWVYGFPLIMTLALGIAFRNQPIERFTVDLRASASAQQIEQLLTKADRFKVTISDEADALRRLRTGKTDLVIFADLPPDVETTSSSGDGAPHYEYHLDPTKPGSLVARAAVDDVLQQAAGRREAAHVKDVEFTERGGRYIDFLVPGLLGMGLMGGGLWGVGFVTVDMRIRKLLKRFVATPMKKSHFLMALMFSRMVGTVPEVLLIFAFSWLVFGVAVQGSFLLVAALLLLGAVMFSGIGLLIASRAATLETVSGLMNLVMLPMWMLSGIFFSYERFPEMVQPLIKLLPLTALIDALRAVMLEAATPAAIAWQIATMAVWTVVSFALALRWFRWV